MTWYGRWQNQQQATFFTLVLPATQGHFLTYWLLFIFPHSKTAPKSIFFLICKKFLREGSNIKGGYIIQRSTAKKLAALCSLALGVLAANAVIAYTNTMRLIYNQQLVSHSHEVINLLESTRSSFTEAENAQRSYLISPDTDYLQFYLDARERSQKKLSELRDLTMRDRKQEERLISLSEKINARLKDLTNEFTLRSNPGFKTNFESVASLKNKAAVRDIQQIIYEMQLQERYLLQKRTKQSEQSFRKTMATFAFAALADVVLVGLLYYFLKRYIKSRKQAEIALRRSENRLRAMIDAEPECVKLIARDGTLLEINASGLSMMEAENPEQLIGQSVLSGIIPEYRDAFIKLHESVCQGNKETLEFEVLTIKGKRRWMETHAVPLMNSDGTLMQLAVTRDITQRKQDEQKIREQAALIDEATNAILVQNLQNQILFWNRGAQKVYGYTVEEAVGQDLLKFLYKKNGRLPESAINTVVDLGEWQGELTHQAKDGREIIVESRWTLLRNEKGQPKSILTVNTEITQKKQLEAQLLRSQRLDSIGTLAGGIAHDLNNVLSPILMSIHLLEMKVRDPKTQKLLKTLENNATRGANLVKQVLSFARGIEGKRTIVQIGDLVREIKQMIGETFPKSIVCTTEIPSDLWYVSGDTTQLHQVLMNLVVNARDAMPNGGQLSIAVKNIDIDRDYAKINLDAQEGAYITISVTDTGMGITPEVQERIFEPFYTTKELGKGTGLGLSTALGIVKNHGGFLHVYSEVGKGTRFQVYLPALINRDTQENATSHELPLGDGELILVVDDEATIREITKSSLESCNYCVLTANNGIEAITVYAQHHQEISLVLMDMMMPEMDGIFAISALQKINPLVKIIAISGLVHQQNITEAERLGVKAFLSKPCTAKELLQAISAVKKSRSQSAE